MDVRRINKAITVATTAHRNQFRKGTDIPYITHPFAVGMLLAQSQSDDNVIIAGILHDTVEDTSVTLEEIRALFGDEVATIVAGCSEPDKSLTWEERKKHTIAELRNAPLEVQLVACADKLHNVTSMLEDHTQIGDALWYRFNRGRDKQQWYFNELVKQLENSEIGNHDLYIGLKQSISKLFDAC